MFPYFTDLNGVANAIFAGIPGREIRGCDLLGCTFCIIVGREKQQRQPPLMKRVRGVGGLVLLNQQS